MSKHLLDGILIDIPYFIDVMRSEWHDGDNYAYNSSAFTRTKTSGNFYMCCCPFHSESNPSFGISTDAPYGYNCFGCGATGNIGELVAHVLNLPTEAHGYQYLIKNCSPESVLDRPPIDLASIFDKVPVISAYTERDVASYVTTEIPYMWRRGFSRNTLSKYEIGYNKREELVIFPVRDSTGKLRFVQTRSTQSKIFDNEKLIEKKDVVYGLYYMLQTGKRFDEIYLVESITDCLACYEGGLVAGAVMGRVLFMSQIKEIMRAGIKTVNLFFDNDDKGRDGVAQAIGLLMDTPLHVNIVEYPSDDKDANELLSAKKLSQIRKVPLEIYMIKGAD